MNSKTAAKLLCESADWTLTQLSVYKGLYIAHMIYLGENDGEPLLNESFEAWDYGPVIPSLYHKLKIFGNRPVKETIFWNLPIENNNEKIKTIHDTGRHIKDFSSAILVNFTHHQKGAWARHYRPGVRGTKIPNRDILEEYEWRYNEQDSSNS